MYTFLVSKFTGYFSNVLAPQRPAAFCGIVIKSIYFVTAPLDFGINFNFLTYNGKLTLVSATDAKSIPNAQAVVNKIQEALINLTGNALRTSP